MPKSSLKMPNVAPRLSSDNERKRVSRLHTMSQVHHFTTAVIGEIVRYDEIRRFGSIEDILRGVYYRSYTDDNRGLAVRLVEQDFLDYENRAEIDAASLLVLRQNVRSAHTQQRDFLDSIAPERCGKAIVVRHLDLRDLLAGYAQFDPVADAMRRVKSQSRPSVTADPYTTSQTPGMRQHVSAVLQGLTIPEIREHISDALDEQQFRQAFWHNVVATYNNPPEQA